MKLDIGVTFTDEAVAARNKIQVNEVTEKHLRKYANAIREDWAGSNDGSEMLANANMTVKEIV